MKKVYGVKAGNYSSSQIFIICDSYNDALKVAAACKDYDEDKAKDFIVGIPFLSSQPITVDIADVDKVINMTINATLKAIEAVESNGDEK